MSRVLRNLGEKGSGLRPRGTIQDFDKIRKELLSTGNLFNDSQFPSQDSSIFFSHTPPRPFVWKRPGEIARDPRLFVGGASRFDVEQGDLGDCWLLAAIANLTLNSGLFRQIVPDDQSFGDNYAGIFHFRFWQYGKWIDVVIDDKLPTYDGKLVFLHSSERDEFWSALFEKAYAKLYGSYEALKGGTTCEAMEDFTGGVSEVFELVNAPPNLYKIMIKAYRRSSLMACSIEPDPDVVEAKTDVGLIKGHAYSVTSVSYVNMSTPRRGRVPLVRVRNPWGNEAEWMGAWSDRSSEWDLISENERQKLGLAFKSDGEFWMSFDDFQKYFSLLEICNLGPSSLLDDGEDQSINWEMSMFEGEWVKGASAGGCRNFIDTFWHNPQYRIALDVPDNDEDDEDDEDGCTVIVALMQKNRRLQRRMGMDFLTVGFVLYLVKDPDKLPKPLDLNFFKTNVSVARSPSFVNVREVNGRYKLPQGSYCIVPSTFEPHEVGEFIIRVFSEQKCNMGELDQDVGLYGGDDSVIGEPTPSDEKAETKSRKFFERIAGHDMEVDWMELKDILDYSFRNDMKEGFSKDLCRSIVSVMDWDRSGKLGFEQFKALWADIVKWKRLFELYDKNGSNSLCAFELRQAFNSAGYRLNTRVINNIAHRYSNRDGEIAFDDFLTCGIRLKAVIDIFLERDPQNTNVAKFTIEEWIDKTLYS